VYIPGLIWHVTHRCHKKEFLLKFQKDRSVWIKWLFEAKKRHQAKILNYMVTSNHIHLLMVEGEIGSISKTMQLIAGRTAQGYNIRKKRKGAFWEDRYHACAIESGEYLWRCLIYIDMNMVRAGIVNHPDQWKTCGYHELKEPVHRYRIIDRQSLHSNLMLKDERDFKDNYSFRLKQALESKGDDKLEISSSRVAMGSESFVKKGSTESGDVV
jgi:putative transposase